MSLYTFKYSEANRVNLKSKVSKMKKAEWLKIERISTTVLHIVKVFKELGLNWFLRYSFSEYIRIPRGISAKSLNTVHRKIAKVLQSSSN